jgi:heme-degrading monooxygenase HmoA
MRKAQIARIWRGRTARGRADEYERYLYEHGIRPLEETTLSVQLLGEDREHESEFITISYWESVQAMSRFAGKDPTAHPSPRARRRAPAGTPQGRPDLAHSRLGDVDSGRCCSTMGKEGDRTDA